VAPASDPPNPGDDFGRTVILPNPGGRRSAEPARPPFSRPEPSAAARVVESGVNPLAAAATSLLMLAVRLRGTPAQSDIQGLRLRVQREIEAFEKRAGAVGFPADAVRAGKYALCATIDDVIQNTPWGSGNVWAGHSMVASFFGDVTGGKRFFDILDNLQRDPVRFAPVLELMFLCLSLGFEGQYRLEPRGPAELDRIRERLFHLIRQQRAHFEPELSPHWKGTLATHRPLSEAIPVWVIAVATVVLLTLIYAGFSYALNRRSDDVFALLANLPPQGEVILVDDPPPPPPTPSCVQSFLKPEIAAGLVSVIEDAQSVTVRIRNDGMFDRGGDTVVDRYLPILGRIGEALQCTVGAVLITGHSDNTPIHTLLFPSNWHLSVARAKAVESILSKYMTDAHRLSTQGLADTKPIADNGTQEGRAQNRRIEVVLRKEAPELRSAAGAMR
jgi:type VI secretion system protein ImpK